jgi:DNA-binding NarL/FixJ family response regulator
MQQSITVALVDDHNKTRELISRFVAVDGITIQLEAKHGQDLLDQLLGIDTLPDVCLLDLSMPVMDGFETARRLRALYPSIRILAYSTNDHTDRVEEMLLCGAHGFIAKEVDPEDIMAGIKAVYNNLPFIRQHETSARSSGDRNAQYPQPSKLTHHNLKALP